MKVTVKTNLQGFKRNCWRKNLHGYLTYNGNPMSDAQVRRLVNWGIEHGCRTETDIPADKIPEILREPIHDDKQLKLFLTMTNEKKALELSSMSKWGFSVEESNAAYNAALEMAQWKDEQIDTTLLTIEGCLRSFFESQGNTQESIDNFINAIKAQIDKNLNES